MKTKKKAEWQNLKLNNRIDLVIWTNQPNYVPNPQSNDIKMITERLTREGWIQGTQYSAENDFRRRKDGGMEWREGLKKYEETNDNAGVKLQCDGQMGVDKTEEARHGIKHKISARLQPNVSFGPKVHTPWPGRWGAEGVEEMRECCRDRLFREETWDCWRLLWHC